MFIYALTTERYLEQKIVKLGCTESPPNRLSTYCTGYPPFETPFFLRVWHTGVTTRCELLREEQAIHRFFQPCRLHKFEGCGFTEWFDFHTLTGSLEQQLDAYAAKQKWTQVVENLPRKIYPVHEFDRNMHHLHRESDRLETLTQMQAPAIQAIRDFLARKEGAGYLVAPCGFGKTYLTVEALSEVHRIIVCCPRISIARQWRDTFIKRNFPSISVQLLGDNHLFEKIQAPASGKHVIISTYNMSDNLPNLPNLRDYFAVFDEVHHMAGVSVEGVGKTRKFFHHCKDNQVPVLGLTFTPRIVKGTGPNLQVTSMDDVDAFGHRIHEVKYRDCVNAGILPLYHIHIVHGDGGGDKLGQRVQGLKKMLNLDSPDGKRLLKRPLVMVGNRREGEQVYQDLKNSVDTRWIHGADPKRKQRDGETWFRADTPETRALVSCRLFGEGVDFPSADGTVFLYDKTSREETVQMLFRAGRWHVDKPEFHVILPLADNEDLQSLEGILLQCAQIDGALTSSLTATINNPRGVPQPQFENGHLVGWGDPRVISIHWNDYERLTHVFQNVRKRLLGVGPDRIRNWCRENNIRTSDEYRAHRENWLPANFAPANWYEFLHGAPADPSIRERLEKFDSLPNSEDFPTWAVANGIPLSLQEIEDGALPGYVIPGRHRRR